MLIHPETTPQYGEIQAGKPAVFLKRGQKGHLATMAREELKKENGYLKRKEEKKTAELNT